jgi:aminoglycoside 3-N-acetyltransferase
MVPTFSLVYEIPPPDGERPLRNGIDYDNYEVVPTGTSHVYSPDSNEINKSMGAIPATVLAMSGRNRSDHPRHSFAAVGPCAAELIAGQSPLDVFSPIRKLNRSDGMIVLMGVGLTRMTALHLAEQMAGRHLFRRWVNGQDGKPMQVAVGGCSSGFHGLEPVLSPLERQLVVGQSLWRIFPAAELLKRGSKEIEANPQVTHCGRETCRHCDDAVAGGAIIASGLDLGQSS